MNLDDLRLNLSYALHEPSTSPVVEGCAQRIIAWEPVMRRAVQRLDRLPDAELRGRIVLLPQAMPPRPPEPSASIHLLSLHLGAWPLLRRAAAVALAPADETLPTIDVRFIDEVGCPPSPATILFRAPANLCLDPSSPDTSASWFGSLAVRPGAETLQLRLDPISDRTATPPRADTYAARVRHLAELAIRSHVEQWQCPGRIWDRPAEQVLPEFRAG